MWEGYPIAGLGEGLARSGGIRDDGAMLSEHGEVGSLVRGGILAAAMMCALPGQGARRENHLAGETSPYLRQHRFNPVDWYPWGKEALARAKQLDRPIFLSIGYSACHWCHVMAEESFSDPEIAKLLNENFVCIKVDREERPDIDEIYMGAVQVMGVSGGWPLSVWLTPEGEPFYGGTYFPPVDRPGGRPAFRRVCQGMIDAWRERREEVRKGAGEIGAHLRRAFEAEVQPGEPTAELLAGVLPAARARFDPVYKGFAAPPGYAPKFPGATELQALLRLDDADAHELVFATLHAMRRGGMHDQLGGGFHRYSTDRRWLVPHFEKMLYDNALLASCYAEAFVRSGDERFAQVVRTTLDYLLREMQGGHGGFFASQDAQSEGVEGKFFVWRKGEIDELLGPASARTCEVFGVSDAGNFGGANVLSLAKEAPEDDAFAAARERLFRARAERVPPATDRKVLADWNGLTLVALCDGYRAIGEPRWLAAAQRAAGFLCRELVVDGRVWHSYLGGSRRVPGLLADHAALARGLLAV
ncbi:MAG TPA: thioredoxin domain-containing protein, partial [bacterium]|nr:thioredoxin domain-containing protein [bacterium]